MVTYTVASFVFSALVANGPAPDGMRQNLPYHQQLVQNEIIIDGKRIDPVVTGQTNADTIKEWERRLKEQKNCRSCEAVNPFPADLED